MAAKRAARAAARGFDLAWVNKQLEEFVARQGDMQVCLAVGWLMGCKWCLLFPCGAPCR